MLFLVSLVAILVEDLLFPSLTLRPLGLLRLLTRVV
jgi:hypothetical protein